MLIMTERSDITSSRAVMMWKYRDYGGVNLNGRKFVMVSSTASAVDPDSPTEFQYWEADEVVWGAYTGDTVTQGRFVGTREGDLVTISYVHALKAGGKAAGQSSSRVEKGEDGLLRLVEEFTFDGDDTPHVSVCVEVATA
jgi:hypothetical protein